MDKDKVVAKQALMALLRKTAPGGKLHRDIAQYLENHYPYKFVGKVRKDINKTATGLAKTDLVTNNGKAGEIVRQQKKVVYRRRSDPEK